MAFADHLSHIASSSLEEDLKKRIFAAKGKIAL
jgi:hypothetical protein